MFFNSRLLALLVGLFIALLSGISIYWFLGIKTITLLWIILFVFAFSLLFVFITLRYYVFKEFGNIYELLVKIKNKDYNLSFRRKLERREGTSPLDLIKREIVDFALQKQIEIEELMKLETFRREFLADVSHELKTPIFAAQGFVHTLLDGAMDDPEVRDKFLTKAASSLDGLNALVQDLITISQLEIGEIKMNHQSFDIHKLAEEIFDQLEETALQKETRLRFYRFSPKSCYVYADKHRIRQVLTNLIVNAIKYGKPKGLVTVGFVIENESVEVSVKDDGPGIESKHLNRIFERFYRIEKSRSKDRGGTGLGLAIVKHILEAHDSKVEVSSVVGQETLFSFKLKKGKVINENG